jgi:diaminopimelate epimerase
MARVHFPGGTDTLPEMRVPFTKMHGNGNDFVLLDDRDGALALSPDRLRRLADRHRGVGCDQILVARASAHPGARLAMAIYNADGSSAGQCGNGLRCFAVYAHRRGMVRGMAFPVSTPGGVVRVELLDAAQVRAAMGLPRLDPAQVPLAAAERAPCYTLRLPGETLEVGAVSLGNPHAVLLVDDVESAAVARLGPAVQALGDFPEGVNVGFMQVLARDRLRLRVFERGVGETLACGSGACAAVVCGRVQGLLDERVNVSLPGGELTVEWPGEGHEVVMTGPTALAFEGEIAL